MTHVEPVSPTPSVPQRMMSSPHARAWAALSAASEASGYSIEQITGPRRKRRLVHSRWLAIWLMRKTTKLPLQNIGFYFGHRDHTTILHGIREFEKLRAADVGVTTRSDAMLERLRERRDG